MVTSFEYVIALDSTYVAVLPVIFNVYAFAIFSFLTLGFPSSLLAFCNNFISASFTNFSPSSYIPLPNLWFPVNNVGSDASSHTIPEIALVGSVSSIPSINDGAKSVSSSNVLLSVNSRFCS